MAQSISTTKIFKYSLIVASFLCAMLLPSAVLAAPYGGSGYGDCAYSSGCPSASSGSTSGGTSSSGSSSSTAPSSETSDGITLLNDYQPYAGEGQAITLKQDQFVYFDVTASGNTLRHKVTINTVGSNYIDITIESDPISDRLYIGDTKQYDVNSDGQKDIEIKLSSISTAGEANITFRSLSPGSSTPSPTTAVVSKPQGRINWLLIASLISLFLGLVLFIILLLRHRRKKGNSSEIE